MHRHSCDWRRIPRRRIANLRNRRWPHRIFESAWAAALLTPRPPHLMILNEPESSLHPDLLPALAQLIGVAAQSTQMWVVSHSSRLMRHPQKMSGEVQRAALMMWAGWLGAC
jgi:hypothetical protein